ncbi:MAG: hypothetical protein ACYC7D_10000 [Nitrososphaerales archaeon]
MERLSNKSVSWGQTIDNTNGLSREVDLIVYEGKPQALWNRAGFVLVKPEQVKATLNRKFHLTTSYMDEFKSLFCSSASNAS